MSRPFASRNLARSFGIGAIPVLLLVLALPGQQTPTTISVDVKVVNVLASVRDKRGQIVSNLTKDDFILEEDGQPQAIRYFARETDLPLTLGLLVDTSRSQQRVLGEERSASYSFLDQMLRQNKDVAFVIHFDHEVELLQDVTGSRQKLEASLRDLDESPDDRGQSGGRGQWPGGGGGRGGRGGSRGGGGGGGGARGNGGTLLYDAVYLAADELMRKQQGRKAVIILSDGVDTGSRTSLDTAIESAQRADMIVYSILFTDPDAYNDPRGFGGMGRGGMGRGGRGGGWPSPYPQQEHPNGKKVMQRIAKETGGQSFEVSKKRPIEEIYASISEELRNQYNLGYKSDKPADASGFRKIHLATKSKDLLVQSRDGYYATP